MHWSLFTDQLAPWLSNLTTTLHSPYLYKQICALACRCILKKRLAKSLQTTADGFWDCISASAFCLFCFPHRLFTCMQKPESFRCPDVLCLQTLHSYADICLKRLPSDRPTLLSLERTLLGWLKTSDWSHGKSLVNWLWHIKLVECPFNDTFEWLKVTWLGRVVERPVLRWSVCKEDISLKDILT